MVQDASVSHDPSIILQARKIVYHCLHDSSCGLPIGSVLIDSTCEVNICCLCFSFYISRQKNNNSAIRCQQSSRLSDICRIWVIASPANSENWHVLLVRKSLYAYPLSLNIYQTKT